MIASLPFAPEIVLPSMRYFDQCFPEMTSKYGFKCSFNPTFSEGSGNGWISKGYYGLDQGPIVLMIEKYRSGFIWQLMRRCPHIVNGLRRADFPAVGFAKNLRVTKQTVGKWRSRFLHKRVDGLLDELRPGTPRRLTFPARDCDRPFIHRLLS